MVANVFGEKLRRLRQTAGMTQRELAARTGLDHTYVSRLERGHNNPPSVDALRRLADALNCDRSVLFVAAGRVDETLSRRELEQRVADLEFEGSADQMMIAIYQEHLELYKALYGPLPHERAAYDHQAETSGPA